jgi:hypothetical protein
MKKDMALLSFALQRRFLMMSGMTRNNPVEDELDAIRLELYEQTKTMSPNERIEYLRRLAAPVHKEFGITPIRAQIDNL